MISKGYNRTTKTLEVLRSGGTSQDLVTNDLKWGGDESDVEAHGKYTITVTLADKAYTAGTDD